MRGAQLKEGVENGRYHNNNLANTQKYKMNHAHWIPGVYLLETKQVKTGRDQPEFVQ